jgi:sulfate/thiosulfate transport system permease protein
MSTLQLKKPSVLPGFGLTMGFTLFYLSMLVLIPLGGLVLKTTSMGWSRFAAAVTTPDIMASYRLSLGASLAGALVNVVFGFLVAWVLVRYAFPGKRLIEAIVDLPFALPTAVSGIALSALYARGGWIGRLLPAGVEISYTYWGVVIVLTFIGLPFVVRTLQPALEDLDPQLEEAAASLGAGRVQTFRRVILPAVFPALLTGFSLSFARALGEYGSVVFIAGTAAGQAQIVPMQIISKLEQYDYAGATALGVVMLAASFVLLLTVNVIQWWSRRHLG